MSRSEAARRGWETRRAATRAELERTRARSEAAKRGWITRRERWRERAGKLDPRDVEEYAELHDLELHDAYDLLYGYTEVT